MRKKVFSGVFALALLATASWGVNKSMSNDAGLSDLALANVEALARDENPDPGETGFQIGNKTTVIETYVTNSPGWTWNGSLKLWIINGSTSQSWPPEYTKTTTTVSIKCCQPIGPVTTCQYEVC